MDDIKFDHPPLSVAMLPLIGSPYLPADCLRNECD